jgi:hypothetical protein
MKKALLPGVLGLAVIGGGAALAVVHGRAVERAEAAVAAYEQGLGDGVALSHGPISAGWLSRSAAISDVVFTYPPGAAGGRMARLEVARAELGGLGEDEYGVTIGSARLEGLVARDAEGGAVLTLDRLKLGNPSLKLVETLTRTASLAPDDPRGRLDAAALLQFDSLEADGYRVHDAGGAELATGHISAIDTSPDDAQHISWKIEVNRADLPVSAFARSADIERLLADAGQQGLAVTDGGLEVFIDPEGKTVELGRLAFGIEGFGRLEMSGKFSSVYGLSAIAALSQYPTRIDDAIQVIGLANMQHPDEVALEDFSLRLEDGGNLPLLVDVLGDGSEADRPARAERAAAAVRSAIPGDTGQRLAQAVHDFVADPGSLSLDLRPGRPVPLATLPTTPPDGEGGLGLSVTVN